LRYIKWKCTIIEPCLKHIKWMCTIIEPCLRYIKWKCTSCVLTELTLGILSENTPGWLQ
jgi:hypothetical protein